MMLTDTPLESQIAAQRDDRLRVLIVGAGMAGLTLAQLLRRDGLHPVLVDRMPNADHPGYMLALMPIVDQALIDLGVREQYRAASTPMRSYRFRSHLGRALRTDPLGELLGAYGDYNGISRGELVDVLTNGDCPVTFDTTVSCVIPGTPSTAHFIDSHGGAVCQGEFDLIIGSDGLHSQMRSVLASAPCDTYDTGWAGWVVWADDHGDATMAEELWGDGFFLGVYPVKDRLGVFFGGPAADIAAGPSAFTASVRSRIDEWDPRLSAALDAVAASQDPYPWRLEDARAPRWVLPGGILLGDAASAFLPTAGIGAGMAIESAWMLARILSHADRATLSALLDAWERVERPRVESAQQNSRMLAKLMFRKGRIVAWLRETVMRMLTVRAALGPIIKLVADRPDPDAVARESLPSLRG